ncbi:FAD-dependent monooxygenase [Actinomycetospora soli]|uniref:FAD-dependent monooxygenase n=1 Tax=Actinomycetospora soli TaxID=2893887 RepID=UPI001E3F17A6|nr:FAD-dependent monooxygenase [Actinomycetospora soli]MCD2190579.1 FAD-dependent monooxygenase [Actinomycetospora soli]
MAQFHLAGYRPGDPFLAAPHPTVAGRPAGLPGTCDVLIVGAGPAGQVLAAQLAAFPELHTVVVDRRDGPLAVGQADGVACRSMEMLEAFGLAGRVREEAYQVNEVTFWRPDPAHPARITRTGRIPDVEDGLSEMPHVIVNQARVLTFLREHAARSAARVEPEYGLRVEDVRVEGAGDHPVVVTTTDDAGRGRTVRARYVVGCDGARSRVRAAIGRELRGDSANQAWGVMDVLVDTDFPDIRLKSAITSSSGSLLVIPREGGYLVRLYVELDGVPERGTVTPETLAAAVRRILAPYTLEVRDVGWWSVYEVGQRLCDRFDDGPHDGSGRSPRVFIAGDACHTHSAKAGQGMNVSMADGWNLGWKLGAVLRGTARPELLHTYSAERRAVAQELIDFDREFAALFSDHSEQADPAVFQRYFRDHGRYTAGFGVRYAPSMITAADPEQDRATGFEVGTRFHSAPVVRCADAQPMHLGHVARADGAWRLYVFADRDRSRFDALAGRLAPLVRRFTPVGADPDAVVDVRAVLRAHHDGSVDVPPVLRPRKGPLGLVDHEKVFRPDPTADVFEQRGIDPDGALVLVRPDQYVAHVLGLDDHDRLGEFLAGALQEVTA